MRALVQTREGPSGVEALCFGCGKWKVRCEGPESGFSPRGWKPDGQRQWQSRCKLCRVGSWRKWYDAHCRGECSRGPIGPYRDWLLAYQRAAGLATFAALADALGVEARRNVSAIVNREYARVSIDVVARAVMNAPLTVFVPSLGREVYTLDDLYPLEEVR